MKKNEFKLMKNKAVSEIEKELNELRIKRVNLKFDLTRTSGTIQPIFRDGKQGGDFVFVLTPVK